MYDDYRIVTIYKIMTRKKSQYIIMKNIHTLMQYNKNYHIRNKYKKKAIQQHTSLFTLRQKKQLT